MRLSRQRGVQVQAVAAALDIHPFMLSRWRKEVKGFLVGLAGGKHVQQNASLAGGCLELVLYPRSTPGKKTFFIMVTSDEDSGGWVVPELERNIRLCIDDKSRKIAAVRSRYPEWWLVLLDHIAFGLDDFDWAQFCASVSIAHDWNRVVPVNPVLPHHYREL